MIQELFHIGPLSISPFGILLALAFLAAYWQLQRSFRRVGIGGQEEASELLIWAGVGGVLGAKLYYSLLYGDWSLLWSRSGLVWYGGFLLGAVGVAIAIRRRRLPFATALDCCAVSVALGYAIGRIGCFLVGDDYGRPTDLPWGIEFPVGLPPTTAGALRSVFGLDIPADVPADRLLAVHPTQLYEALAALVIWRIGVGLLRRERSRGTVTAVVVGLLALERFAVEFVRVKDDRFFGSLTLAQLISLGVAIVSLWWWASRRRPTPSRTG
ncbi:MAG: prolipoprotein diacylglyceryl transferase [Thermoanaerobaculia bacterium]|nr:prolipoprotein diacylglyceryl transferase [Thermoanaerobaculia bacterium]